MNTIAPRTLQCRQKRTVTLEQYFTKDSLVKKCIDFTNSCFPIGNIDLIIEPSAGAGAFLSQLPSSKTIGLDISPLLPQIIKADYFDWQPPRNKGSVLVIGNPPFGQRGSLAMRFLIKSFRFADCVAFILPRSFKKFTFQNRIPLHFHLAGEFDCDEFETASGVPVSVKSVFQVWVKKTIERETSSLKSSHADFEMKHCHLSRISKEMLAEVCEEYSFAIPQVGANFKPRDSKTITMGSYWFIKPNVDSARSVFEKLDFSFLHGMNTAFTSLSKKDIIRAYDLAASTPTPNLNENRKEKAPVNLQFSF